MSEQKKDEVVERMIATERLKATSQPSTIPAPNQSGRAHDRDRAIESY